MLLIMCDWMIVLLMNLKGERARYSDLDHGIEKVVARLTSKRIFFPKQLF